MSNFSLRSLDSAPAEQLAALQSDAFADHVQSGPLAEVIASESAARSPAADGQLRSPFGLAAFRGDVLVGWSQGYREGTHQFYMLNSGVARTERRKGVYSMLVKALLAHAQAQGYSLVRSRHVAANSAVIIAKLKLGFLVTGFEYSEVYGPLVQLTCLLNPERRKLYADRAAPLRPAA